VLIEMQGDDAACRRRLERPGRQLKCQRRPNLFAGMSLRRRRGSRIRLVLRFAGAYNPAPTETVSRLFAAEVSSRCSQEDLWGMADRAVVDQARMP
jgi:hypothetical protein